MSIRWRATARTITRPLMRSGSTGSRQRRSASPVRRFYSLVDVDSVALPSLIRPFTSIEVNNSSMPVDLVGAVDSVPEAQTVVYNQVIFVPGQKKEMAALEKKKNRHASIPSPANQMAVEDIKNVQDVIARESMVSALLHGKPDVPIDKTVISGGSAPPEEGKEKEVVEDDDGSRV